MLGAELAKVKKVIDDATNLLSALSDAIADGEVNDAEIATIINRAKVLGKSFKDILDEIIELINR